MVLASISRLGTNTLEIFPGKDFGDVRSGKITTLVVADAEALAHEPYAASVTPTVSTSGTLRFGAKESSAQINGVGAQRSEEHTSELQSLMRISYAVFCLNKKKQTHTHKQRPS